MRNGNWNALAFMSAFILLIAICPLLAQENAGRRVFEPDGLEYSDIRTGTGVKS